MVTKACSRLSRPPASIATRRPSQGLPVATATQKPAMAPMSIMPSTPRLSTPARSAKISPIAANSRTVPLATPAARMSVRSISVGRRAAAPRRRPDAVAQQEVAGDQAEQDDALDHRGMPDGWISRPARISAPNRIDATTTRKRVELGQPGDDDAGEAVAGRDAVLQPMDDAADLGHAGQAGQRRPRS